jgi:hypothetical protein
VTLSADETQSLEVLPAVASINSMPAIDDSPSWELLKELANHGGLTEAGKNAVYWALEVMAEILGGVWPERQFRAKGFLPSELLMASSHIYVLPQFLWIAIRLREASSESSFKPVLSSVRRGIDLPTWRHLLLQLEVERAFRATGATAVYEPALPGTRRHGDLLVKAASIEPFVVEATTLFRSAAELLAQKSEDDFWWSLVQIEQEHGVHAVAKLTRELDPVTSRGWLDEIDRAASLARTTNAPQVAQSTAGQVEILLEPPNETVTFSGMPRSGDGWRRLASAIREKAHQTAGQLPVWLRVDAADGFFQFTDWQVMTWPDRIERLEALLRVDLKDADHVEGVVLSSGPCGALGASDADAESASISTEAGVGLRRLLAPSLVRETAVIPLRRHAAPHAQLWASAYGQEPSWLGYDLAAAGLPQLASCWLLTA